MEMPEEPSSPITLTIIGAGERGQVYSSYAKLFPKWVRIVAVAEIHEGKRQNLANEFEISKENTFSDWKDVVVRGRISDAVAICTPDRLHAEPAIAFANQRYNILLEKPMSISLEDCRRIVEAIERNQVLFTVGHVLRYSKNMSVVMDIINSKALGDIINIQHLEPIGFWHFAHSFVRGNWNNEQRSTFSLMSKSCHDIDLIRYMIGSKCTRISSFGSLNHFCKEKKPKDAGIATTCFDCQYEPKCCYSAKKIYLEPFVTQGRTTWPNCVVQPTGTMDIESLTTSLQNSSYGKCVYELGNDVCDNQVVNFEFENGATATFTMVAFTERLCERQIQIFGTKGELRVDLGSPEIVHYDFLTKQRTVIDIARIDKNLHQGLPDSGHFGGDYGLLRSFIYACVTGKKEYILTGPQGTLDSHVYVFAAEESRTTGKIINITEFRKEHGLSN